MSGMGAAHGIDRWRTLVAPGLVHSRLVWLRAGSSRNGRGGRPGGCWPGRPQTAAATGRRGRRHCRGQRRPGADGKLERRELAGKVARVSLMVAFLGSCGSPFSAAAAGCIAVLGEGFRRRSRQQRRGD
jgi:hypothetical protein